MLSNFLIITLVRVKIKVKHAPATRVGAPTTLTVAIKSVKILSV